MFPDGDVLVEAVQNLDLSDAEIEDRISKKITDLGMSADEFSVTSETDSDKGTRMVKLTLPSDNTESGQLEMQMCFGFSTSGSEYRNMALTLKSGKLVKVHMDDEEIDGDVIIMKVTTDDSE